MNRHKKQNEKRLPRLRHRAPENLQNIQMEGVSPYLNTNSQDLFNNGNSHASHLSQISFTNTQGDMKHSHLMNPLGNYDLLQTQQYKSESTLIQTQMGSTSMNTQLNMQSQGLVNVQSQITPEFQEQARSQRIDESSIKSSRCITGQKRSYQEMVRSANLSESSKYSFKSKKPGNQQSINRLFEGSEDLSLLSPNQDRKQVIRANELQNQERLQTPESTQSVKNEFQPEMSLQRAFDNIEIGMQIIQEGEEANQRYSILSQEQQKQSQAKYPRPEINNEKSDRTTYEQQANQDTKNDEVMAQQDIVEPSSPVDSDNLQINRSEHLDELVDETQAALELENQMVSHSLQLDRTLYQVDPDYMTNRQREIQWHMRVLLIDWMSEVSEEFALQRETNHLAVLYVDLYLSRKLCPIERLQCLGAASLLLACKMEEIVCPRVKDFAHATDNGFTTTQLIEMESEICLLMQFRIQPTTLNYWANYFMAKWDLFAKLNYYNFRLLTPEFPGMPLPIFKSNNAQDYKRFRSVMQVLDLIILEMQSYNFDKMDIVAAAIYFEVGLFYKVFNRPQIAWMPDITTLLINIEQRVKNEFAAMMQTFFVQTFQKNTQELVPAMKFVARFFGHEAQYRYPLAIRPEKPCSSQEEFYSYQAHVKGGMDFIKYLRHFNQSLESRTNQTQIEGSMAQ